MTQITGLRCDSCRAMHDSLALPPGWISLRYKPVDKNYSGTHEVHWCAGCSPAILRIITQELSYESGLRQALQVVT